jgi:hypothetical protein
MFSSLANRRRYKVTRARPQLEERGEKLMSRWMIEKSGTGIEKSGTGIEKSGTGIEKAGTGIERSGTGIEKSGTGIRRGLLACTLAALTCAGNVQAGSVDPAGSLQIVVNNDTVAISWIIGDSVFSGISKLNGSYVDLMLTEVSLSSLAAAVEVTGTGTGTESSTLVTGTGTGSSIKVTGTGTGSSTQVTGTGTGTGSSTLVTGTGTGTGSTILVTGTGTGSEAIRITLPNGTSMKMEVSLGCGEASVSVIDNQSAPVVEFTNVPVIGDPSFCGNVNNDGFGSAFRADPGRDFRYNE